MYPLRQRWAQQPQGPVGIDWANPLARGLICAVVPRVGDLAVQRQPLALATGASFEATSVGVGLRGGTGYGSLMNPRLVNSGYEEPVTVAALALRKNAISAVFLAHTTDTVFQGWRFCYVSNYDQLGFHWYYGNQAARKGFSTRPAIGSIFTAVAAKTAGTSAADGDLDLYFNGKLDAPSGSQNGIGNPNKGNGTLRVAWGDGDGGSTADSPVMLVVIAARKWSASEVAAFHENPWQLFAPLTRRIYSLSSAAGIPTLSAATVTSITATSATPRVTLTF